MWLRLRVAIIKELQSYLRDPATRRLLIGAPILQTVLFAFAATLDVQNIDVAIFDQDNSRWSQQLVSQIDGAWFTDELVTVYDQQTLDQQIAQRKVILAVRVGPEFSRDITAGRSATVQVIADGRRANAAQISVSYMQAIFTQLGADIAADASQSSPLPEVSLRHRYNSNLNYRWFMVVNLTALLAMFICLVVTALSISREREMGTFDQLLVSPITTTEIMIAKTFPGLLAGGVVSTIISLLAVFVFGAPFLGSIPAFILGLSIFSFAIASIGLLISSVAQTQQQAVLGTFFGSTPFVLTSGFATPWQNMPVWLQNLSLLNPLRHYAEFVQGNFFKGQAPLELLANLLPLVLIAVVCLFAATVVVKRRLE
jgi:ABC-2 type transport system permease protein